MPNGENAIIAALDIGTNSFHLVIAKVVAGGFEVIETEKETVRIGHGAGDMNELSADAIARGPDRDHDGGVRPATRAQNRGGNRCF